MSQIIQIKRGTQAQLSDIRLRIGELAFTTDTKRLFIGSDEGNLLLASGKKKRNKDKDKDKNISSEDIIIAHVSENI